MLEAPYQQVIEQMELVDFIWKGKCSLYIFIRTKQYNKSSDPEFNNGATSVPDSKTGFGRVVGLKMAD